MTANAAEAEKASSSIAKTATIPVLLIDPPFCALNLEEALAIPLFWGWPCSSRGRVPRDGHRGLVQAAVSEHAVGRVLAVEGPRALRDWSRETVAWPGPRAKAHDYDVVGRSLRTRAILSLPMASCQYLYVEKALKNYVSRELLYRQAMHIYFAFTVIRGCDLRGRT